MTEKIIKLEEVLETLPEDKLVRAEGFIDGLIAGLMIRESA